MQFTAALKPQFLLRHLANFIALGAGSGLLRHAPGTWGTAWAWLFFTLANSVWPLALMPPLQFFAATALLLSMAVWASAVAAKNLNLPDPGCIVIDEIVAFWLVLYFIAPCPWWQQLIAFALFRVFDALKPGPVAWADAWFKHHAQRLAHASAYAAAISADPVAAKLEASESASAPEQQDIGQLSAQWLIGVGIVADDLVAAALTLLCMALLRTFV